LGITIEEQVPALEGGRVLVVMEHASVTRYQLPARGALRIGRSEACDVVLRDPAASRVHALLHLAESLEIEDLGSHNGTLVQRRRMRAGVKLELALGDCIQIGGAVLMVQNASRSSHTPPREPETDPLEGVVVREPRMHAVYELVERVAPSGLSVLILGETGAGKEVVAESIHRRSGARSRGPFVRINCAALSESLLESELFGHERGAFTGALRSKPGLLEVADKGTAFLDEVGELPPSMQAKLLRAVESRELTRVGGIRATPIDVRFVAATNRDLRAEVERGAFREDLYFRLNGLSIAVPPLRERPTELDALINHFLSAVAREMRRPRPALAEATLLALRAYPWPGNIRELRNVVESAALRATGERIEPGDLPRELLQERPAQPSLRIAAQPRAADSQRTLSSRQQADRERILSALSACHGNQTRAAEYLGMPRRTLVAKLSAYGIPRPRKLESPTGP
jgi:DNA-binding NtrC family response regulator